MPQNGLKMGSFHPFVHPKWSRMMFGKMRFSPIFDPFLAPTQPIFKAFWDFRRTKMDASSTLGIWHFQIFTHFHPFPPLFTFFLLIFTMDSHTLVWALELE